jgi:hypothetical protein
MIAGETEVLGENLPQRHFVPSQIPHDQVRFWTPDRSGGKPATNHLSYGTALNWHFRIQIRSLAAWSSLLGDTLYIITWPVGQSIKSKILTDWTY